ncbi:TIGR04222 domain-containing membrane protein, partial [Nocardia sp. NPDC004582]
MVHATVAAAATTNTWGISGPAFLLFYVIAGLIAVAAGYAIRASVLRRVDPSWAPERPLTPSETAVLVDDRRPVLAALAQLRGHGVIDSTGRPVQPYSDTALPELDPIARTLWATLSTPGRLNMTSMLVGTGGVVARMRKDLTDRGYLFGDEQRKALRTARFPLYAVLLLGLARLISGVATHHSVGFLVIVMIALSVMTVVVGRGPRLTRRGRETLEAARTGNRHLRPANAPAYAAYGASSA